MQGSLGDAWTIKWRARINLIEWGLRRIAKLRNNSNRYNLAGRNKCDIVGRVIARCLRISKHWSLHKRGSNIGRIVNRKIIKGYWWILITTNSKLTRRITTNSTRIKRIIEWNLTHSIRIRIKCWIIEKFNLKK